MDERLSCVFSAPDAEFAAGEVFPRHDWGYWAVGEADLSGPKDFK
jgi:hypothetical protein